MSELLIKLLSIIGFIGLALLLVRFFLGNTKETMSTSVNMQEEALSGQRDAIEMTRESLELQKETLSEMREIKKLLEKR